MKKPWDKLVSVVLLVSEPNGSKTRQTTTLLFHPHGCVPQGISITRCSANSWASLPEGENRFTSFEVTGLSLRAYTSSPNESGMGLQSPKQRTKMTKVTIAQIRYAGWKCPFQNSVYANCPPLYIHTGTDKAKRIACTISPLNVLVFNPKNWYFNNINRYKCQNLLILI